MDEDTNLPMIAPSRNVIDEDGRVVQTERKQVVMAISEPEWRGLVEALDIREPMIDHKAAQEYRANKRART